VSAAGLTRTMGSWTSRLLRLVRCACSLPAKHRHSVIKRHVLCLRHKYSSIAIPSLSRGRN